MKKLLIYCAAAMLFASCTKENITGSVKTDAASKMLGGPKIGEPTGGKYVGGGGKYVGGGGKYVGGGGKYVGGGGKYVGGGGKKK